MRIRRIGIVGAGTMGSGIAALAASAGVPVVLLDVPAPVGDRNATVKAGLERAKKAKPAAFMDPARASAITIGNTEDGLAKLATCDLVIEAIIEDVGPKRVLYEQLESVLPPNTIIASNTSGIPMSVLLEGRTASFRSRFLGMHFFNPPRYLHLLEIIPTPDTSPETLAAARRFSDRILGKGIVLAKDVPGFVANRLGVFGMVLAIKLTEKYDLSIDEVDVLTGTLLGRSKSATYRTADLSGIDVIGHVTRGLSQSTGEDFSLSSWVMDLIKAGRVGEKSGAGFYKKDGKEITTLDWKSGEYRPQTKPSDPQLGTLSKLPTAERFAAIRGWQGKYGDFAREYLLRFSHYVLETSPSIAYDIPSVDHAIEWGYAWEAGPFRQMDLLGREVLTEGFAKLGLGIPKLLEKTSGLFYTDGTAVPLGDDAQPVVPTHVEDDVFSLGLVRRARGHSNDPVLANSPDATVWNAGNVAVLEFHSKMNTLGKGVIEMVHRALDIVEKNGLEGLVIGNEDPRTFTAGADLMMIAGMVQAGDWKVVEHAVKAFQDTSMRLRTSPFPVVIAPFGLTLGGGCEFSLHADHVQAHAELYMGLVEVGVGLIPAGGGTKELLFRFTSTLAPYGAEVDLFDAVKRAFQLIAMGTTSTSALDARNLGYLGASDRITMNRERLLTDAIARVKDLSGDYVAPLPRTTMALGREALGNLKYGAWAMREAGQISDFEVRLANDLAYVLAGGDGPPRVVTEQDILDLEREVFLSLLGTKETKARIEHMLKTGKVLRET